MIGRRVVDVCVCDNVARDVDVCVTTSPIPLDRPIFILLTFFCGCSDLMTPS